MKLNVISSILNSRDAKNLTRRPKIALYSIFFSLYPPRNALKTHCFLFLECRAQKHDGYAMGKSIGLKTKKEKQSTVD